MFSNHIEPLVNRFSKFWLHLFKVRWKYLIKFFYEWNTKLLDSEAFRNSNYQNEVSTQEHLEINPYNVKEEIIKSYTRCNIYLLEFDSCVLEWKDYIDRLLVFN